MWNTAIKSITKLFPHAPKKGIKHAKSRYQLLKSKYKIVRELREQSGFGWDEASQMVTASPDVWSHYLKSHPKAKPFHAKPFPLYDAIATLVDGVIATGETGFHPSTGQVGTGPKSDVDSPSEDEPEDDDETPAPAKRKRESSPTPSPSKASTSKGTSKKRQSTSNAVAESVANAMKTLASSFEATSNSHLSTPERKAKAFAMAQAEEGLSDEELTRVGTLFRKNIEVSDMFIALKKGTYRSKWLAGVLDEE
ncbi:hypothetical protein BOTBODRAFT_253036 [Botryobasidium botryosum FD-172 SS1]|uniref:Myb/SANT-like domain-containing protein n=1 Tax=Botryobasidium botryosum (strain FD-172 SS1) TaxID=930990 RepID=A0A067MPE6_BOTB1|nr:hypothetical protein BOTBODRAFT_253036 [Botryobasidium botryosum FD-172 SS1]